MAPSSRSVIAAPANGAPSSSSCATPRITPFGFSIRDLVARRVVAKADLEAAPRARDGSVHEFKATSETLEDLKVGDRIQAKRQPKASASD